MLRKYFIRFFINTLVWKYIRGSKRFDIFPHISDIQFRPLKDNLQERKVALFSMIEYCHKNVPYYTKYIEENAITYALETIEEDIRKFPILTKDILRTSPDALRSVEYTGKYITNHSGGSTGEPVQFLQDRFFLDHVGAMKMLFNSWAGRQEGDYAIKLWGSDRDTIQGSQGVRGFLVRNCMNFDILNSFQMDEKKMHEYRDFINQKKPIMIEAYTQSLYEFALFLEKSSLSIYSPRGIITSAGTLFPSMREVIERVFGCRVFDRYGTREVGDVGCTCEHGVFHYNTWNHFLEVLDPSGNPVAPGQSGKIHITTLNNHVMPLIRYDIGDIATVPEKEEVCPCGRGLPVLQSVEGREMSVFRTRDSSIIPGEFFIHFVGVVHNHGGVKKFQVIQEDYDYIIIKVIVADDVIFEKDRIDLVQNIRKVMGESCRIDFEKVDTLDALKSGKYLYTVSKVS